VTTAPETLYTRTRDGTHVAYRVIGAGPPDVVFLPDWTASADIAWEEPRLAAALTRLASFCRLVLVDRRGIGASDAVPGGEPPTVDMAMDDVRAVIDALELSRVALMGMEDGGAINMLFAATNPQRVSALVLINTYARLTRAPDFPIGLPPALLDAFVDGIEAWGAGTRDVSGALRLLAPSRAADPAFRQWFARASRLSASPGGHRIALLRTFQTDVRSILPLVRAPTLVLHSKDDLYIRADHGRYLAEHIDGARYVELRGDGHYLPAIDLDTMVEEIAEFLTGTRHRPQPDRVLATVVFTDIVDSTGHAARLGDARWRSLLDDHDELTRREVERFSGRVVKMTGDGVLATFDGPTRGVRCACAVRDAAGRIGIEIRAGVHTGEVELRGDDVGGLGVHLASRIEARAAPGEVLVSRTVTELVAGSGIDFRDCGEQELRGVPGTWRLFSVAE
jgi:class 3 adenylate cyclase